MFFEKDFDCNYVWEARAKYDDDTDICKYFPYDKEENDDEEQYVIEEWLISRHKGCVWYSVNLIDRTDDLPISHLLCI